MASWLKPRKIMGIALRLALVVGVLAGAWSFLRMHWRYLDALDDVVRIEMTLKCAQHLTEEELAKHKNAYGLIDLGKTFCAPKTFLASMAEIRGARTMNVAHLTGAYESYVRLSSILIDSLAGALAVVALGVLIVFLRWLTLWVLGVE